MKLSPSKESFVDFLLTLVPARSRNLRDRIDLFHQSGENSILWKGTSSPPPPFDRLPFYEEFDAALLFGGAFQVRSLTGVKRRHALPVIGTVSQLASDLQKRGVVLPVGAAPFMSAKDAGYALDAKSGKLLRYDLEARKVTGRRLDLESVIEEWYRASHPSSKRSPF